MCLHILFVILLFSEFRITAFISKAKEKIEKWYYICLAILKNHITVSCKNYTRLRCVSTHIFWYIYSFMHRCIHSLGHLPPCPPPTLSPFHALISRQNLLCPIFQFCWREDISNNKKDLAFLLVWDKDCYTGRFLALLPCICVLQPELIHLYQTSLLFPSHLPIVTFVSLRLLY
jgi:hypothetical protein